MWDLIVSVPDHCLSFYLAVFRNTFHSSAIDNLGHKSRKHQSKTISKTGLKRMKKKLGSS